MNYFTNISESNVSALNTNKTWEPIVNTTKPTAQPTFFPTHLPTHSPTISPTHSPTISPTHSPTISPTHSPTISPTHSPTNRPTKVPTKFVTVSFTEQQFIYYAFGIIAFMFYVVFFGDVIKKK
eukprot:236948_1